MAKVRGWKLFWVTTDIPIHGNIAPLEEQMHHDRVLLMLLVQAACWSNEECLGRWGRKTSSGMTSTTPQFLPQPPSLTYSTVEYDLHLASKVKTIKTIMTSYFHFIINYLSLWFLDCFSNPSHPYSLRRREDNFF